MKTGIVTADPRKVCWKTYMYHGILMRCRVSCEPEPVKPFPIGPVVIPPTFTYPCDGLPDTAAPPMTFRSGVNYSLSASGGLLRFRGASSDPSYANVGYYWKLPGAERVEFDVSFLNLVYEGSKRGAIQGSVSLPYTNGVWFGVAIQYSVSNGFMSIDYSNTRVSCCGYLYYDGPFNGSFSGLLIKNATSGLWDIYFNGVLVKSGLYIRIDSAGFAFGASYDAVHCFGAMDYFNVWLNTNRFP